MRIFSSFSSAYNSSFSDHTVVVILNFETAYKKKTVSKSFRHPMSKSWLLDAKKHDSIPVSQNCRMIF
jgi:hypothetical protein